MLGDYYCPRCDSLDVANDGHGCCAVCGHPLEVEDDDQYE